MKSLFPRLNKHHLRIFLLFLALIGVASACSDRRMPTLATPSRGDSVNLPPTERLEDNNLTLQTETQLATPSPTQDSTPITSSGKYLFIEFWNHETGSGNLPMSAIDFPHYYFDPTNGTLLLHPSDSITLSPTDLGFIGQGTSLSGAMGMGSASGLAVIDRLPYSLGVYIYVRQGDQQTEPSMEETRKVTLTVLSAAEDGTISIELDGQTISLVPGQSWEQTVEKDVKTDKYDGHLVLTSTLTNYGWQDRGKINVDR